MTLKHQHVHYFREIGNISVIMLLPVPPPIFLLLLPLLHLVSGHPLSVPPALQIRAQGPGSRVHYVPVARTLVKQVLRTHGTALNCLYDFQEAWFHQLFLELSPEVGKYTYMSTRRGCLSRSTVRIKLHRGSRRLRNIKHF